MNNLTFHYFSCETFVLWTRCSAGETYWMRLFLFHLRSQSVDYLFHFEWYCNEWRIFFPSELVIFLHMLSLPKIYESLCSQMCIMQYAWSRNLSIKTYSEEVTTNVSCLCVLPGALTQAIRNFAKSLESWLTNAMMNIPEEMVRIKVQPPCAELL